MNQHLTACSALRTRWSSAADGFAIMLLAVAAQPASMALAAELEWRADPPPGLVIDEKLETVLQQMAAYHGLKTVVSDELDGRVTLNFEGLTIDQIMDELSAIHQFDWFYDGQAVYFFPIASVGQQIMPLHDFDIGTLLEVLDDLQLIDSRYPIVGSDEANVALVSGPPQYITLVEQALAAMLDEGNRSNDGDDDSGSQGEPIVPTSATDLAATTPVSCPALSRRAECLPRVNYGYAAGKR